MDAEEIIILEMRCVVVSTRQYLKAHATNNGRTWCGLLMAERVSKSRNVGLKAISAGFRDEMVRWEMGEWVKSRGRPDV